MTSIPNENEIWLKLINTALEDGMITEEEMSLIKDVIISFEKYSLVLEDALEDGYISLDEKIKLFKARKNILDNAFNTAIGDNKISKEEYVLLETILDIICHIEKCK